MNNEVTGYVLSVQEYKEHDAMIKFLSYDLGLLNLVLPGYYKANTKQSRLGLEFSNVTYTMNYRENRLNRIVGGQLNEGFFKQRDDYDWLIEASILSELVIKLYHQDNAHGIYDWYEAIINEKYRAKELCKMIYYFSKVHGITPNLSGCSICDSKAINSFSIRDAGFLCQIHSRVKDDKDELAFLYSLALDKDVKMSQEVYENVLNRLIQYISYYADLNIHSWKLKTRV
ncbi:DNA repair protein RecO [Erysipelothrix urinaevulpis]|uniref:DNA repair protein RecO n=1 Tax=Erysipelothrix urinaevulpis TaxID=2683717 RepID=UPI00135CA598|nr:DNA repair protein RecO [Erysipelothrix urinaevulpis]